MRLSEKQASFTKDFAAFVVYAIRWCDAHGYTVILEECYRHPTATHGHPNSTHRMKLAGHLILFKGGEPVWDSAEYRLLGDAWENLHIDNRWGGRFLDPDGVHFSRTNDGIS